MQAFNCKSLCFISGILNVNCSFATFFISVIFSNKSKQNTNFICFRISMVSEAQIYVVTLVSYLIYGCFI